MELIHQPPTFADRRADDENRDRHLSSSRHDCIILLARVPGAELGGVCDLAASTGWPLSLSAAKHDRDNSGTPSW